MTDKLTSEKAVKEIEAIMQRLLIESGVMIQNIDVNWQSVSTMGGCVHGSILSTSVHSSHYKCDD